MDEDWILALEYGLIERWNWSLHDIDQTDIESLIPFVYYAEHKAAQKGDDAPKRQLFADEVNL